MKIEYFWMIIIMFLLSCNHKINENKSTEEPESTEKENIYEFSSEKPYFQFVDDLNSINDFEKYFKLENNVVISKDILKPFTGEITINCYYNDLPELNNKRKLQFINGYLSQVEHTNYRTYKGIIERIEIYKVFTFINKNKQMEYYFSTLENYTYFDRWLFDDTFKNELVSSMIGSGFPGGLIKITNYKRNEEIESEGYGQWVTIPYYHDKDSYANKKGDIGWTQEIAKIGIWKFYAPEGSKWDHNGEKIYEKMWVLKNEQINDIENYKF